MRLARLLVLLVLAAVAHRVRANGPVANPRGELLAKLPGPAGTAAAFSRDDRRILTAGGDEARVWDAATFKPLTPTLLHRKGEPLHTSALSADGTLVLTAAGGDVRVWDVATGKPRHVFALGGKVNAASFSPDGRKVLAAGEAEFARIWDATTGKLLVSRGHPSPVWSAEFSGDGRRVLSLVRPGGGQHPEHEKFGSGGGEIVVWDAETGELLTDGLGVDVWPYEFGREPRLRPAAVSPDGSRLVVRTPLGIMVRNNDTGKVLLSECTHCNDAWAHKPPFPVGGPQGWVTFTPDGRQFLTTGTQGSALLWDSATGALVAGGGKRVESVSGADTAEFSADGKRVLVTSQLGLVCLTDVASGKVVMEVERAKKHLPVAGVSSDGQRVVVGFPSEHESTVWRGIPQ